MSHSLKRNTLFTADVQRQFSWCWDEAGEEVAWRFERAVEDTLRFLSQHSESGRQRRFHEPELNQLRSYRVIPPFNKHLLFFRLAAGTLEAWRLMHGARDLPRRLLDSSGTE